MDASSPARNRSGRNDDAIELVERYLQRATEVLARIRAGEATAKTAWLLQDELDTALFCSRMVRGAAMTDEIDTFPGPANDVFGELEPITVAEADTEPPQAIPAGQAVAALGAAMVDFWNAFSMLRAIANACARGLDATAGKPE